MGDTEADYIGEESSLLSFSFLIFPLPTFQQTSSSSCFIVLKCYSDLSDDIVKNQDL